MYCRLITSWLEEPLPEDDDEEVVEVGLVCACAEADVEEVTGVLAFTIGVRLGSDLGPGRLKVAYHI